MCRTSDRYGEQKESLEAKAKAKVRATSVVATIAGKKGTSE